MEAKTIQNNDLDRTAIEQIKVILIEQKNQILKEMGNIAEKNGGSARVKFPDYGTKIDENAQEIDEYTKNLATEKVLESSLRDVENALERIEKGNYGICKYCKEPIGKKRLLARPVASACVTCKTKLQNSF
jgi:RNA polymerase-binding protein DksA